MKTILLPVLLVQVLLSAFAAPVPTGTFNAAHHICFYLKTTLSAGASDTHIAGRQLMDVENGEEGPDHCAFWLDPNGVPQESS
jgi:hypothetical protein